MLAPALDGGVEQSFSMGHWEGAVDEDRGADDVAAIAGRVHNRGRVREAADGARLELLHTAVRRDVSVESK